MKFFSKMKKALSGAFFASYISTFVLVVAENIIVTFSL